MAKFERYEPRNDADRIFDGGEIEEEDEEGSRLPLLLVIGLLVVAAFAGVVWLAYSQGVRRGMADSPRMLVASTGPVKEAPANPGGTQTPFKNLKIYQQPAPAEEDDVESTPQAPTPTPKADTPVRIVATPNGPDVAPAKTQVAQTTTAPQQIPSTPPSTGEATHAPRALEPSASQKATPTPPPAAKPVEKPVASAKPATSTTAATEAPAEASPKVSSGGVVLQIGAYKSEAEANAAWEAFTRKHAMAAGYSSDIRKVDLADKGIWYRLRLGSFADKSAASVFCDKLKADGGNCFLAR